jgi:branched-chain amino acid transport system permease protein
MPCIAAIAIGLIMQLVVGPVVQGFAANVLVVIGINIMLAVSLNVVNGYTGQFSIGHAAHAGRGYVTAMVVYYGLMRLWLGRFCAVHFHTGVGDSPVR